MKRWVHLEVSLKSLLVATILFPVVAIVCSADTDPSNEPALGLPEETETAVPLLPDEISLIKGPLSPDGLQAIFATPDLGVGENRVAFVLTSTDDIVRAPVATVSSFYYPSEGSEGEPRQTVPATFRPWPYGTRGTYTTSMDFDTPGSWGIDISVVDPDGSRRGAQLSFEVEETPVTVAVGSPAVASHNKTLDDVEGFGDLTTGSLHDPDLYRITVADAIVSGLPTVIVMASPAFCTNAVCGPQVQVLQELKNKYTGQANFIHVDFYDNPEEIQGDLTRARFSPTVVEWRLPSTEWSFVVNGHGTVSARFESFATFDELEQVLQRVL